MQFTQDNHLKYWIGDRLYGNREHGDEPYRVEIGSVDHDHLRTSDWVSEQRRTADLIKQDFGRDLVVMFSGGTDSEIVLRSFLSIGLRPRVVFIRFKDGYNEDDYFNSWKVCADLRIDLESIDFDVKDFYHSGAAAEFAAEIQCRQIAYLSVYYHIKQLNMPAVMGGEMLLRRQVYRDRDGEWYYVFRENEDASAMRFSLKYGIPLVNEWFSYTPEMMAYYLTHPTIESLVTERHNYKLGSVTTKNRVLREYMPELIEKTKTHGYERLIGFNMESYDRLYTTHVKRLESCIDGILLDDFKRMLYGEKQ